MSEPCTQNFLHKRIQIRTRSDSSRTNPEVSGAIHEHGAEVQRCQYHDVRGGTCSKMNEESYVSAFAYDWTVHTTDGAVFDENLPS